MAGAGYKLFNTGDVLTAAQVNTYLQEQTVMVFASSTARTTALSGVLAEGMVSYLQDTNAVEVYNGSAWVGVSGAGDVTEVQAGTGISVASGTGPIPVVTNTMATEITASGDIIVGTGSGTFDNLPIGTTGQVLTADTTVSPYKVKWATASSTPTFVGVSLYKSGNQSISNVSTTAVTFDSEHFDTDGFHSTVTNTSRITIPAGKGGYYRISGNLKWDPNATGDRAAAIYKNGSNVRWVYQSNAAGTSAVHNFSWAITLNLVATDYVELYGYQSSGGNLNVLGTTTDTSFEVSFIGA